MSRIYPQHAEHFDPIDAGDVIALSGALKKLVDVLG